MKPRLCPSFLIPSAGFGALILFLVASAPGQSTTPGPTPKSTTPPKKPDFPPYKDVIEGYEKVVSTMDGKPSFYTIWVREKDNQMLAELPKAYAKQKHYIALTIAGGEEFAGLQIGEMYVYWKRYDKRLALIEPNIATRSTGDPESKESVERLFTDRVILDVPIVTLAPGNAPVIDMDALLVEQASKFFGSSVGSINPRLASISTAKAFPENVELAFEAPISGSAGLFSRTSSSGRSAGGGRLKTLHYSISLIPDSTGYKPRVADQRIGYFTTGYTDLGKYKEDDKKTRYINRWNLEKADPSLKLSPPKNPIIFYIEHTTPRRYRYWVKEGILRWNKAFEEVGIRDAIVVEQQDNTDPKNPRHMEKDPEDVRYNFVRWLNNDVSTAIGPSRVHPLTGEILDADIILTDGWIRYYEMQFDKVVPKLATEGFSPQTFAWLEQHPNWDPRILLAPPAERNRLLALRAHQAMKPHGGHPAANADTTFIGDDEYDGLIGRISQTNGMCLAADCKAFEVSMLRMTLDMLAATDDDEDDEDDDKKKEEVQDDNQDKELDKDKEKEKDEDKDDEDADEDEEKEDDAKDKDEKKEEKKEEPKVKPEFGGQVLDGIPEQFIGPLLADLVAHEVGHTLGLRHNFKSSGIYSLDKINSEEVKGKPQAGSVMDYLPINMHLKDGKFHGDHCMMDIGPYDMWAIEYGYSFDKDLKPILARVAEPDLVYGTDEDTWGPDPLARRYDFSSNPLDYAKSQVELAKYHRARVLDKFVKDGDSWAKAREGYEMTLMLQVRSLSMMANWVGGAFVYRDKKGDKNAHKPLEVVPAATQREALDFTIEHAFPDEAFGLTPQLIQHLSADQWLDDMAYFSSGGVDWPVHDRIMGIQTSVLTMLMNPDTLRLVYDNEVRTPCDDDMVTLPELLGKVSDAIWTELDQEPNEKCTARKPWISSLRRNLQREHLERLIDLTLPDAGFTAAYKPISNLALMQIREIDGKIGKALEKKGMLDPYSAAHLGEAKIRIEKALDAQYIYNVNNLSGGGAGVYYIYGAPGQPPAGR